MVYARTLQQKVFRKGLFKEYISMSVGYDYCPVNTDRIRAIISQIHPDQGERNYLFKQLSQCLNGLTKEEFYIFPGLSGANGKSFETNLISKALGSYAQRGSTSLITGEREESGGSNSSLMALRKKRFVYFQEPSRKKQINVATMKEMTGGDTITARELYVKTQQFKLICLMVACCNLVPNLDGCDGGTARRLNITRFSSRFVDNPTKKNEYLINHTYKNEVVQQELAQEMIYVLLEYYYLDAFPCPQSFKAETQGYLDENNPIINFIQENICKKEGSFLLKKNIKGFYESQFKKSFRFSEFILSLETELESPFIRDKNINGIRYNDVMIGYCLVTDNNDIDDDLM